MRLVAEKSNHHKNDMNRNQLNNCFIQNDAESVLLPAFPSGTGSTYNHHYSQFHRCCYKQIAQQSLPYRTVVLNHQAASQYRALDHLVPDCGPFGTGTWTIFHRAVDHLAPGRGPFGTRLHIKNNILLTIAVFFIVFCYWCDQHFVEKLFCMIPVRGSKTWGLQI